MNDIDKKKVAAAAAVVVVLLAGGFMFLHKRAPQPAPVAAAPVPMPAPAAPPPPPPPPPAPPAPALPDLAHSDDFVRAQAKDLSSEPGFAAWLKAGHLLGRLTAAVDLVGRGRMPSDSLSFLAPRRRFSAARTAGRLVIGAKSYARYDAFAAVFASIDASKAAALAKTVDPLLRQACQDLGENACDFRASFARAASEILRAPVPSGPVEIVARPNGLIYEFADKSLEKLDPVQKLAVRLGPANEGKVQAKLKELAAAMGVPDGEPVP